MTALDEIAHAQIRAAFAGTLPPRERTLEDDALLEAIKQECIAEEEAEEARVRAMCSLYRCYGGGEPEDDDLLYIGITGMGHYRWTQHARAGWWQFVHRIEIEHFENRELAKEAEQRAIEEEKPAYNVVHNRRRKR